MQKTKLRECGIKVCKNCKTICKDYRKDAKCEKCGSDKFSYDIEMREVLDK